MNTPSPISDVKQGYQTLFPGTDITQRSLPPTNDVWSTKQGRI